MNIPTEIKLAAQWIIENCIVLDTETTGLGENDTVIELAAMRACNGDTIINTLIKPLSIPHSKALAVNGISEEIAITTGDDFANAAYHLRNEIQPTEFFTSYNLNFDERLMRQSSFKAGMINLPWPKPDGIICIMELANRAFHEHLEWDAEQSKFKRLSLARCCEITGIEFQGDAHRALVDVRATIALLHFIANDR